jgi:hypothetical protein
MRAWIVFVGALVTGWCVALWVHNHLTGGWYGDSRSDPWACIVWVIVTLSLVWIVGWLDDRY